MKTLFRILTKITGHHSTLFYFFPIYLYEDETIQKRKLKEKTIVASNHKKPIDFVLMKHIFILNYLQCLVGETIYNSSWIVKLLLNLLGSIEVNRIPTDMSFMDESLQVLKNDGHIEIYPEGRLPMGKQLLPFHNSTVYMAMMSGATVVPVYQNGNYGVFKRVSVVIGKPMVFESDNGENPTKEHLELCTKKLRDKIIELKAMLEGDNSNEEKTI